MIAFLLTLVVLNLSHITAVPYTGVWEFQNYCAPTLTGFCTSKFMFSLMNIADATTPFPACSSSVSIGSSCNGVDRNNLSSCYFPETNVIARCLPLGTELIWHVNKLLIFFRHNFSLCEDDMNVSCSTQYGVGVEACPVISSAYGYGGYPCSSPNARCKVGRKIFSCLPQSGTRLYFMGFVNEDSYPLCPDVSTLPDLYFPGTYLSQLFLIHKGRVENGVTGIRCNFPGQFCITTSFSPIKFKLWQCHHNDPCTTSS